MNDGGVLLVEGNPTLSRVFSKVMNRRGVRTVGVSSAEEANVALAEHEFSAVLVRVHRFTPARALLDELAGACGEARLIVGVSLGSPAFSKWAREHGARILPAAPTIGDVVSALSP